MRFLKSTLFVLLLMGMTAEARPYLYPQTRYQDAEDSALGGVTLPITDGLMGNLMNNPAALVKDQRFQAEYFNLQMDVNSNTLSHMGTHTPSQVSMNSYARYLNADTNQAYGLGGTVSSAFSWHGLGVGILMQERDVAASDGNRIYYNSVTQTIPTVGYGLALARGVVRLGYSLQYVNETSGTANTSATAGPYGYTNQLPSGHAFANNASVNFVFPFTYLPTLSLVAKNIFGLHYLSGSLPPKGSDTSGLPADEPMVVDAALNFMIRVTGTMKTNWYFQYKDPFGAVKMPVLERFNTGAELVFSKSFALRGGITGLHFSAGFGYKSDASEINFAWYHEQNPLSVGEPYDTRWVLQYVLRFQDKAKRDRSKEN